MSIFDEKLGDLLETSKYKDFLNFELLNCKIYLPKMDSH